MTRYVKPQQQRIMGNANKRSAVSVCTGRAVTNQVRKNWALVISTIYQVPTTPTRLSSAPHATHILCSRHTVFIFMSSDTLGNRALNSLLSFSPFCKSILVDMCDLLPHFLQVCPNHHLLAFLDPLSIVCSPSTLWILYSLPCFILTQSDSIQLAYFAFC